jgi:hypothetical protein
VTNATITPLDTLQTTCISIALSARVDIVNKASHGQLKELASGWHRVYFTLEELAMHIGAGFSFCPPLNKDCLCTNCQDRPVKYHRLKANWQFSQYLGLDFDTEPDYSMLKDPLVAGHAHLWYNTASSTPEKPKFRIVLPLSEPISDTKRIDSVLAALKRKFPTADQSCFERSRMWYGSNKSEPVVVEGPWLNSAELDLIIAENPDPFSNKRELFTGRKVAEKGTEWAGTEGGTLLKFEDFQDSLFSLPKVLDSYNHWLGFCGAVVEYFGSQGLLAIESHWPQDRNLSRKIKGLHGGGNPIATILATFRDNGIKPKLTRVLPKLADRVTIDGVTSLKHHTEKKPDLLPSELPAGANQPSGGVVLAEYGRYNLDPALVTDRVNARHLPAGLLSDLALKNKAVMVWSPKNSGKTTKLKELVAIVRAGGGKVLAIGPRRALMKEMCEKLGLAYYEDYKKLKGTKGELSDQSGIGIVLDSVPSDLDTTKLAGIDLLIFDEYEQTLKHLTGDTIRGKRIHVVNSLAFFIKTAKHVVALDADCSAIGFDYLANYVEASQIKILHNSHKAGGNTFFSYETESNWNVAIDKSLLQGHKIYVALNSLEKSKVLAERVATKYPNLKVWLVNSEEASTLGQELVDQIKDINNTVQSYDVVIASPTLSTGVDIFCHHFHSVFLYGGSKPTNHKELLQQAGRVRNPILKEVHCFVSPAKNEYITEPEVLLGHILENMKETTEVALEVAPDSETGKRYLYRGESEDTFNRLYLAITSDNNASLNNLAELFFLAAGQEGNTVKPVESFDESELVIARTENREAKDRVAERFITAVVEARDIAEPEFIRLKNKDYKNAREVAEYNKHSIARFYGRAVDSALVELDNKGKKRKQVRNYRAAKFIEYARAFDKVEAGTRTEWAERTDQRIEIAPTLAPYLKFSTLGRNMAMAILEAAGLRQPTDKEVITYFGQYDSDSLKSRGFVRWCRLHAEEIQRKLGLKVKSDIDYKPAELVAKVLHHLGLEVIVSRVCTGRPLLKEGAVVRDKKGQIVQERARKYQVAPASVEEMEGLLQDHMEAEKKRLGHLVGEALPKDSTATATSGNSAGHGQDQEQAEFESELDTGPDDFEWPSDFDFES